MDVTDEATKTFGHDELITITLEKSSDVFTVSKALLCDASDYFKKALDGGFQERGTRKLCLPGCDEETFKIFLFYLANKKIPRMLIYHSVSSEQDAMMILGRLWIFGDGYLIHRFQNEAMGQLIESLLYGASTDLLELAYEHTTSGSALRRACMNEFVGDCLAGMCTNPEDMNRLGSIPGFFRDFAVRANCQNEGCVVPSSGQNKADYMVVA